jgi:carboxymethylenebutenolidase
VQSDTIVLTTPDGDLPVYEADPELGDQARGGVLVFQDAFGVTEYLEDVTRRLAALGWHALAPQLFHRTGAPVVPFDRIEDTKAHTGALTGAGILVDIDACLRHLAGAGLPARRVAAVGFCMGGTIGYFTATRRPLAAVSSFYGNVSSAPWPGVPAAPESWTELRVPWLGLFGDRDAMIPTADVEHLRELLLQTAVPTEIVRYPEANHAFHRDVTPDWYHEASAKDAWERTLTWFEQYVEER